MKALKELFNSKLDTFKTMVDQVYETTTKQYQKQKSKSLASYQELTNVYPKRGDIADDFQDFSRVGETDGTLYDNGGFGLAYTVEERDFIDDVYTRTVYPMNMLGGEVIAGSDFRDIFKDSIGFWGYKSNDKVDAYFVLDFKEKTVINKVYLQTNNEIDVALYIKEEMNSEWVEIGKIGGSRHMWNFEPRDCASMKFLSNTDIFVVSRVNAGLANYNKSGVMLSKYYSVENLYHLKLKSDYDQPKNTGLEFFVSVSGHLDEQVLSEDTIITGGVEWHTTTTDLLLPSGFLEDSISIKAAYNEWSMVDTYDWVWSTIRLNPDTNGIISLSSDYRILEESVKEVKWGDSILTEGTGYSVSYYTDLNQVVVRLTENGSVPFSEINTLNCTILCRKKTAVKQLRAFVELLADKQLILQGFDESLFGQNKMTIRQVIFNNGIEKDTTQEINELNRGVLLTTIDGEVSYLINGKKGTNLIELEFIDLYGKKYIPKYVPVPPQSLDYCLEFNGTDTYVEVPDADNLDITKNITVECWVKFTGAVVGEHQLISHHNHYNLEGYVLLLNGNELQFRVYDGSTYKTAKKTQVWTTGEWYHVVGTYNGTRVRAYVNGYEGSTSPLCSSDIKASTEPLRLGRSAYYDTFYFEGKMDEVRVSNSVRYSGNFDVPTSPFTTDSETILLMHLDEGGGVLINDVSGNGNNGLLNGTGSWDDGVFGIQPEHRFIISNAVYFSRRFPLELAATDAPDVGEYALELTNYGYEINLGDPTEPYYLEYATMIPPSGISYMQVGVRFTSSNGQNSPVLRAYELENTLI